MSKSLAELRAEKDASSLPTRVEKIVLDQALIAKVQRLETEKQDLQVATFRAGEDKDGPPRRFADVPPPRLAEIDTELAGLYDEMRASEGELLLRATSGGKWQMWKDAHPARKDNASDDEIAYSLCNATDLLNSLALYVAEWNGEPLGPGEWDEWFMDKVAPADLRNICTQVVSLHETKVSIPKSLSTLSGDETNASA